MNKKIRMIVFWGLLITLIGCKTKQSMLPAVKGDSVSHSQTETNAEKLDSLKHEKLDYKWISYRANVNFSTIELNNLNAFVVNRKDSILYITVSKMGIEGARLVLTPDSVKFINHIASNYYVGNYSILERLLGVEADFYIVQSLLTGENLPENTKSFIQASYGNFTTINSQLFFQQADFIIPKEDLRLTIIVKSVKLNEAGPTSIRIPEKYTPMPY
jgi:hypothetical protein